MRCEQLTHSATRVKGMHQPRPGTVVVPPAGGGGRWPYHPPWTPAGKGSKGVGAQSNGGGSSREDIPRRKPRGGKRELSERQAERSSGPLDVRREGAVPASQTETERGSPHCTPAGAVIIHPPHPRGVSRVMLPLPETERCAVPSPSRPPTKPRLPPPPCATRVSAICPWSRAGTPPRTARGFPRHTKRLARPIPGVKQGERKRDKSQARVA